MAAYPYAMTDPACPPPFAVGDAVRDTREVFAHCRGTVQTVEYWTDAPAIGWVVEVAWAGDGDAPQEHPPRFNFPGLLVHAAPTFDTEIARLFLATP